MHHVDRKADALTDARNQRRLIQSRYKEAGRAGLRIDFRALDGFFDTCRVILHAAAEQVGPCVDEEFDALLVTGTAKR
jgi:hypothetical protein